MLGVKLCHLYHLEGEDVCVTPFSLRQTRIFTPEEAAEIVLIIDLCILLLVTIIGLFMNDPYRLVSSASHEK